MKTKLKSNFNALLPWLICSIGALFYCYVYFLRGFPTVISEDIIGRFDITASAFGNLTAFYYYAYTPLQLPVGVILDRYGTRLVLSIASLFCTLGIFIFSISSTVISADLGRFLMGFGGAFAYVSGLKLASVWLPEDRFATATGALTAAGMLMGALTLIGLPYVVDLIGTQTMLYVATALGVVVTMIVYMCVRNRPAQTSENTVVEELQLSFRQLFDATLKMLRNPQMWIIGLIGCLLYLPCSVFLDTWGMPYLETSYHLPATVSGSLLACISFGWVISGPIIGALSDFFKRRRLPLLICASGAALLTAIIFYVPNIPISMLYILFFSLGAFCGSHPLCFVLAKENYDPSMAGTSVSVTNCLIMLGGVIFQPLVGVLIDYHWNGATTLHHHPLYTNHDFLFALSILPIALIASALLAIRIKETLVKSLKASPAT